VVFASTIEELEHYEATTLEEAARNMERYMRADHGQLVEAMSESKDFDFHVGVINE
jgi:hypothetical protein